MSILRTVMIRQPSSMIVAAPSGSGKTQLVENLLHEKTIFQVPPTKIVYAYDRWQLRYDRMKKKRWYSVLQRCTRQFSITQMVPQRWCVGAGRFDGRRGTRQESVASVYQRFSPLQHHRVVLMQDLFLPGKHAKTINKNVHYITAFKNPQDKMGISNILMQMYPDRWKASCSYIMTSPLDPMVICSWTYTLLPTTVFVCGVI